MMLVLSPSKTLDESPAPVGLPHTQPEFLSDTQTLIAMLRKYPEKKLGVLMDISPKLAALNVRRYKDFHAPFTIKNAKQALLMFKGDVYEGIEAARYTKADFAFAQEHMRILSGLYGLLKPLDLMQPYRLEMGTHLANARGKDLYDFWDAHLTKALNKALSQHKNKTLINLASEEYFTAVQAEKLAGPLLNIVFKEKRQGKLQIIGLLAKKARGRMADFIIKHRINEPKDLKKFTDGGYGFEARLSDAERWVFVR